MDIIEITRIKGELEKLEAEVAKRKSIKLEETKKIVRMNLAKVALKDVRRQIRTLATRTKFMKGPFKVHDKPPHVTVREFVNAYKIAKKGLI